MARIAHRSELRVYDRTGSGSYTVLPAVNVTFSRSLGGGGFLSATFDARLAALVASPTMLDDCVIKLATVLADGGALVEIAAYANRARNGVLHSGAGLRTREVRSAPTLWTAWSQDAVLYPEGNALTQMSAGQRYFGFQSSIYDHATDPDYTWGTPSGSAGQQDSTSGDRAGNPDGWPTELGNAYWITRPSGTSADLSRHLFIADVTVPSDCYLTVYASSDESAAIYFGGAMILQYSASETGYLEAHHWSAWVVAGTYRVAIDKTSIVSRGGDGIDPVLLAVATNHDNGAIDDILLVTNDSDWVSYAMLPFSVTGEDEAITPSLTPGEILTQLHAEALGRGVTTWAALSPTWAKAQGSDAVAWQHREERVWRVGYDRYLDIVEGLGDLGVDVEITPALAFHAYANRGTDRSATVVIEALLGADEIVEDGVAVEATVLLVETQDGWTPELTSAAMAARGRRESALSLGNAPSIAQGVRLGRKVLDEQLSRAPSERTVQFYALPGCVPFSSFNLGDTIGVKIAGVTTPGVVLGIAGQQDSTEGIVRWTAKIGDVLP